MQSNRGKDTASERALRPLADMGDRFRSTTASRRPLTSCFVLAGKAQYAARLHDMG
jgi:hypothetical protein